MKIKIKEIMVFLKNIGTIIFITWLIGLFIEFPIAFPGIKNSIFRILLGIVFYLIEIVGLYYFGNWMKKERGDKSFRSNVKIRNLWSKRTWIIVCLCLLIALTVVFVYEHIIMWIDVSETANDQVFSKYNQSGSVLFLSSVVLFGPICEEILYRHCFFSFVNFGQYLNKYWLVLSVIINGTFFAFLHSGCNLVPFIYYSLIGITLASCYVLNDGDVKTSILVHIIGNTIITFFF
ncbi:lysostaphin resistance A-like protein [Liquorilactobacillus hordei]|uniref:CPBP family intramembrane glutamic endopeptidase n=1 Tax=Liquorilactobacillus hordei TaxID=468911 RepID=UPI0039E88E29